MRPTYEKQLDRWKQEGVLELVKEITGWDFEMTEPFVCFDAYLRSRITPSSLPHTPRAIIEVKVREKSYQHFMISKQKIDAILTEALKLNVTPLLAVAWTSELRLGIIDLGTCEKEPGRGGRQDRQDPQDMEEVYFIPRSAFSKWKVASWPWQ